MRSGPKWDILVILLVWDTTKIRLKSALDLTTEHEQKLKSSCVFYVAEGG